jgi:hypothetical protein
VCIDPTDAAPVQPALADERDDVSVGHHWCLMHLFVVCKKLAASTDVADQELSVNEIVPTDLVSRVEWPARCGVSDPGDPYRQGTSRSIHWMRMRSL